MSVNTTKGSLTDDRYVTEARPYNLIEADEQTFFPEDKQVTDTVIVLALE